MAPVSDPASTDGSAARRHWRQRLIVDFYLYSSHEVAVWEPLWRCLRQRGVDAHLIIEPPGVHRAMGTRPTASTNWTDDKDGPVVPLVDDDTFTEITQLLERRGVPWLEESRPHADAVITTQGTGWLDHYGRALRIKTEYGASVFVGPFGHGTINRDHDAVLVHGDYSRAALRAHVPSERLHTIGYPKWAPTLRQRLSPADARALLGIENTKPVLAWLPTWAHNSSIDDYGDALGELADSFLVVVKPHHNNVRFEADRLAAIDERIVVRSDLHSLVPLLIAADVVVADSRSGALAETFLADRPAVGLLPGIEPIDHGVPAGLGDAIDWCRSPGELRRAVTTATSTDRSAARATWRNWLFTNFDGRDDEVGATTIIGLIEARTPQPAIRPALDSVDVLVNSTDPSRPDDVVETLATAWPCWPGHPNLLTLLETASGTLGTADLASCARLVRTAGLIVHCPLVAAMLDESRDPVARLAAAAVAATDFEDPGAADSFSSLVDQVSADRFGEALYELDLVPSALPVFVHHAATTPERCRSLAVELDKLGAADAAASLLEFGDVLVTR